jgi:hypothetical protein
MDLFSLSEIVIISQLPDLAHFVFPAWPPSLYDLRPSQIVKNNRGEYVVSDGSPWEIFKSLNFENFKKLS